MKRILITGSSGQAGSAIAKILREGYEVIGADLTKGEYTHKLGNLSDPLFIQEICQEADGIIHTAALHAPHVETHSRTDFIDTNIRATLLLLEEAHRRDMKKFVYTSTTSLYGESMVNEDIAVWVTEELPPQPRDIYDITKIAAEGLCKDFHRKEGLNTMVLRVSRFWDEPMQDKVFYRMYRGLDARDVAMAHQLALESELKDFHIFNISAQPLFNRDELIEIRMNVVPLLKARIPKIISVYNDRGWQLPSTVDRVYSIDKANELLSYTPNFDIHSILDDLT